MSVGSAIFLNESGSLFIATKTIHVKLMANHYLATFIYQSNATERKSSYRIDGSSAYIERKRKRERERRKQKPLVRSKVFGRVMSVLVFGRRPITPFSLSFGSPPVIQSRRPSVKNDRP